jgi:hypothetical protein
MKIDRRLDPGQTYRIEIHNYAGLPANEVAVKVLFWNTAGVPGG